MISPDSHLTLQITDQRPSGHGIARIDSLADNVSSRTQPAFRIVFYRDGLSCHAEVPELPDCVVTGESYSEVLLRIQQLLSEWLENGLQSGSTMPKKILNARHGFSPLSKEMPRGGRRSAPIKARLIKKFGKRSNRELAACIGIVNADAPIMLSSAMAGNGTRTVRCAIAVALNELPSSLWPGRTSGVGRSDDACYHSLIRSLERTS